MRIAVIGSGISGVGAAWMLSPAHHVDVYEAESWLGGHARTLDVAVDGQTFPVDTGFMVFNDRTYPNLCRLFERLGVHWTETDMSFSVQVASAGVEWSGTNLNTVFAQRHNIANPRFLRMIADVLKFSRDASRLLADPLVDQLTLGQLLEHEGYSDTFIDWYLIPMGASIWSTPAGKMLDYPAGTFLRFCDNHGLLHVTGKPMWRSVTGGSRTYVAAALNGLSGEAFVSEPVERVSRDASGVTLHTAHRTRSYDAVIIAAHAPQSLAMLQDPTDTEREVLGAFGYQPNRVFLHTDASYLPNSRRAWASWNWYANSEECCKDELALTYWIDNLQSLTGSQPILETLNPHKEFAAGSVLSELSFDHPLFTGQAIAAQTRLPQIQGVQGVWYAGAWQRYGFHEDGLLSGIRAAEALGATLPWGAELDGSRTKVLEPGTKRAPDLEPEPEVN